MMEFCKKKQNINYCFFMEQTLHKVFCYLPLGTELIMILTNETLSIRLNAQVFCFEKFNLMITFTT